MKYKKSYFILCAIMLSAIGFPSTIKPTSALTYSSDTDIEFTFNSVISINLSSPNLIISDLAPGEYSDSNIITVGANTNASMGYQLSATVGQKNGTDALVNTISSSNTFANLTSAKATLANFSDNTWGYSYCADTSTNCGTSGSGTWVSGSKGSTTAGYAGLPLDNNDNAADRGQGGVLLLNTSSPEDTVQSVQFKIGAKASSGQASGDYTNTINFYAVANPEPQLGPVACEAGKICYNENALTPVEGTMGKQTASSDGDDIMLLASNFSRSGYGFAGWNTSYDYTGNSYGPHETITMPDGTAANGLSLYAIWVKSAGSIQNWTCPNDAYMSLGDVTALTDQRDGNTYAVAKLADGKCWMIENLRLENTATDNTSGSLSQGYGGQFAGLAEPEVSWGSKATSANSLYSIDGESGTINIGSSNGGLRFPRYNNINTPTNDSDRPILPTTNNAVNSISDAGLYSYGNYYTWASAIANTTHYSSGNRNTTSICPSGWKIPTGGVSGEYYALYNILGTTDSSAWAAYPNNFIRAGIVDVTFSSIASRGTTGDYWTSTASATNTSYCLRMDQFISPGIVTYDKSFGFSVRCITD